MKNKQKKINAYYKSLHFAHSRDSSKAKRDKCQVLANKLFVLEREFWDDITKASGTKREIVIPTIDYNLLSMDVIIDNPSGTKHRLDISDVKGSMGLSAGNFDIYGTGYNLPTDRQIISIDTTSHTKRINVLRRENRGSLEGLPVGTYIDSSDYFGFEKQYFKDKKRRRKKTYLEIARRDGKTGKISNKRVKIEKKDYYELTNQLADSVKTEPVQRQNKTIYLKITRDSEITNYLESISLDFLYNEKIKSLVYCKSCSCNDRRKNTLKDFENGLACTNCGKFTLKIRNYKIRFYYINVFTRYELNERTGYIRKQIDTSNGYKTIYKGSIK